MNQKRAYYIFRVVYPDEVTLSMLPLHLKLQESLQRSILAVIMRHFILCMTIRTISMPTLYLTASVSTQGINTNTKKGTGRKRYSLLQIGCVWNMVYLLLGYQKTVGAARKIEIITGSGIFLKTGICLGGYGQEES